MIEHHKINGKDVWVEVIEQPAGRENPNTIPTEYFKARYYLAEPPSANAEWINNEDGEPQLFESPVAALTFATKKLMNTI
ncbi:hypothetical protein [Longitalea arenae]|uniref:hypothetical protein n=1 Tax=Longitalea arenae TaxID=2812558 RepID=UPI001966D42F|nr:hypothetical protein [Longitalea arenae]